MLSRQKYKEDAKASLRKSYLPGVGVSAVSNIAAGLPGGFYGVFAATVFFPAMIAALNPPAYGFVDISTPTRQDISTVIAMYGGMFFLAFIGMLALTFFISLPFFVGEIRFYCRNRRGQARFDDILFSFRDGNFPNITAAMALSYVYTLLWSLLLVIPGIVKAISYSMVPFILSDNPEIGAARAVKLSMAMTQGHKWDIFVLYLSFIGWFFLCGLTFGIGYFFLAPYFFATLSELYADLRGKTIQSGIVMASELKISTLGD